MDEELHIAGIVVHAHAQDVQRVADAIGQMPAAALHATSADGKLIVTLEASSARAITERIDAIQRLEGVLTASLVYQHSEPLAAMMEEVSHEDDPKGIH